jgi:hypothetical protein
MCGQSLHQIYFRELASFVLVMLCCNVVAHAVGSSRMFGFGLVCEQLCNEEFVEKWSDASEGWMYLSCLRVVPEMTAEARGAVSKVEAAKPSAADAEQQLGGAQAAAYATKEEERLLTLYRAQQVVQHMEMYQGRLLHSKCHFGVLSNIAQSKRPTSRASSPAVSAAPTTTAPAASAPAVTPAAPSPSPQPAQAAPLASSASTDSSTPAIKAEEAAEQPPQPSPPQEQPQPQPQEESPTPPQPEPIVVKAEAAAPVAMDESKDATITDTTADSTSAPVVTKPTTASNNNAAEEENDEDDEDDDEPPAFVITADGV